MDSLAIAAALLSALIHASWNALLKSGADRVVDSALVAVGWFGLGALGILISGPLPSNALPYVVATALIHSVYWTALTKGYAAGDLSHVYTLSRGLVPLLVAIAASVVAREVPHLNHAVGIVLVSAGVIAVGASRHAPRRATLWALAIALTIAAYSLIDALGARSAGSALVYSSWMLFASALPLALLAVLRRGLRTVLRTARGDWRRGIAAGVVSGLGYGIVLFAQTRAPVAQVTALRETSVAFAAVIAWIFLRERLDVRRWLGAMIVAAGAVVIAFG